MRAGLARAVYLGVQRMRGEPVAEAVAELARTEHAPLEELRRLRGERMLALLRHAVEHVPYYRETWPGAVAERIRGASGWRAAEELLGELPALTRGDVVSAADALDAAGPRRSRTYPTTTSGSSGQPVRFACDLRAWAYRHALSHRAMAAFGVEIGEPYAYFFGLHWGRRGARLAALKDAAFNRVRVSPWALDRDSFAGIHRRLVRRRPTHVLGYPAAIADYCSLAAEHGVDLTVLGLKAVFCTAETLLEEQRATIGAAFGCPVSNLYGSAELGICAYECPAGSLHVPLEAVWLELDPRPDGAHEVVATELMQHAHPLLRYRTGDESAPGQPCGCGRSHPTLAWVAGRVGDAIVLPSGRRINPHVIGYMFRPFAGRGTIRQYRFVQSGAALRLQLVTTPRFTAADERALLEEVRRGFGEPIPIEVEHLDELPALPNAKHRVFVRADPS